jgi:HD-like signal output (HDOD) protein
LAANGGFAQHIKRKLSMKQIPTASELKNAFDFLKGISIPKIPEAVLSLQQEMTKKVPDLAKIAAILATDMALSGMVLKTINSASFGLSRKIDSVHQATIFLGLNTLKEVVLISALKQSLGSITPFQVLIWNNAQGCALGSKAISFTLEDVSPETAFLVGLFNEVGALIMEKRHPEYADFYRAGQSDPTRALEKETSHFGTNRAVISFLLSQHWNLPEKVSIAIYNSQIASCTAMDDPEIRALIAILKISDSLSKQLIFPALKLSDAANRALADAYIELAAGTDALEDMKDQVEKGVW